MTKQKIENAITQAQEIAQADYENVIGRRIDPDLGTVQISIWVLNDPDRQESLRRAFMAYGEFNALEALAVDLDLPSWRSS